MAHEAERLRRHTDAELSLILTDEEAMCLDAVLDWPLKTTRVQVNVTFKDNNGVSYHASRIVKMRLRREKP